MGMYERFTPVIQLDEITTTEENILAELAAITYATGDILYYNGSDIVKLAIGSSDQILKVSGGLPAWGTFSVSGGGTGLSSMTVYTLLAGGTTATGPLQQVADTGSTGQVLTSNGPGALPNWQSVGGAPTSGSYVVISAHATLTDERVLTGTADQVVVTDNGAGNSVVLSLPQSINTTSSPTFNALTATSIIIGANTITTSEWANLDGLNQTLATTSSPTFNAGTFTSIIIGANTVTTSEWANLDGLNQTVATTSSPTFVNLTITSFAANWTNAGRTVADMGILTTVDINGGTLDGVTIGGSSAAAATVTTLTVTSIVIGANTVTTSEWANLDGLNQTVATTSSPTFVNLTITSFAANWTNAGRTVADLGIVTTVDINGGTVDGATIGTSRINPRVVSMADATSFTPTGDTADENTQANTQAIGTLTANAPSGTPVDGQRLILRIKSTNVQTYSWNAIYRGSNTVALPTASTGSSKTDYVGFIYNSADTKWDCVSAVYGYT